MHTMWWVTFQQAKNEMHRTKKTTFPWWQAAVSSCGIEQIALCFSSLCNYGRIVRTAMMDELWGNLKCQCPTIHCRNHLEPFLGFPWCRPDDPSSESTSATYPSVLLYIFHTRLSKTHNLTKYSTTDSLSIDNIRLSTPCINQLFCLVNLLFVKVVLKQYDGNQGSNLSPGCQYTVSIQLLQLQCVSMCTPWRADLLCFHCTNLYLSMHKYQSLLDSQYSRRPIKQTTAHGQKLKRKWCSLFTVVRSMADSLEFKHCQKARKNCTHSCRTPLACMTRACARKRTDAAIPNPILGIHSCSSFSGL